ncbi:hypothetical protein LI291_10290 [Intestinibacillus massiliensis]|nr:hypothetical protein [Intestinibacillus massiliensis]
MQGLRGQEGKRFERYWALVQAAAHAEGCVFFLECGAGRPFEDGGLAGEDLRGWLIPEGDADVFEMEWRGGPVGGGWDDAAAWAVWDDTYGPLEVRFQDYPPL